MVYNLRLNGKLRKHQERIQIKFKFKNRYYYKFFIFGEGYGYKLFKIDFLFKLYPTTEEGYNYRAIVADTVIQDWFIY